MVKEIKILVEWFTAEDWRTWVSHLLLTFLGLRGVAAELPVVVAYLGVVVVMFLAVLKEVRDYNRNRKRLDAVVDGAAYVLGALLAAWTLGLF